MGTISLQVPQSGLPNSTEDPKIAADFTALQALVNGNIDTNNISPTAGITRGQLATGVGRLTIITAGGSLAVLNGQLAQVTAGNVTLTLQSPSFDATCGVFINANLTPSNPCRVNASGGTIVAVGAVNITTFTLATPGACVLLQSNGTDWFVLSGQVNI